MDKLAFVIGNLTFSWHAVLITLAVLTAIVAFHAFFPDKEQEAAGLWAMPLCLIFGILLSRLIHWYCRSNSYESFFRAMTDYSSGGYALAGVFAGCLLTAALLRLFRISRDLPGMLDAMCIAGSLGIALGRPAFLFSSADHGQILSSAPFLPQLFRVTNMVSGSAEYRVPTCLLQAVCAGLIFLVLAVMYFSRKDRRSGDLTLVFLLLYSCSQILLDSTRVDSLYFRSNGFVSVVQILSAVAAAFAIAVFSIRLIRAQGMHSELFIVWLLTAGFMGVAGYMEYYVQRHSLEADFAYTVMGAFLAFLAAAGLLIRRSAVRSEKEQQL